MPEYQPHLNAVANLFDLLLRPFPVGELDGRPERARWHLEDGTKPQPDLIVMKGPRSRYRVDAAAAVRRRAPGRGLRHAPIPATPASGFRKYAGAGFPATGSSTSSTRRVEVYESPQRLRRPGRLVTRSGRTSASDGCDSVRRGPRRGSRSPAKSPSIDILRDSLDGSEAGKREADVDSPIDRERIGVGMANAFRVEEIDRQVALVTFDLAGQEGQHARPGGADGAGRAGRPARKADRPARASCSGAASPATSSPGPT